MLEGLELLTKAVGSTLGPSGKTVIIHNDGEEPFTTKDGVTVAEAINHPNPIMNAAIQLFKKVSSKMNIDSGDGTTTVTVICYELIRLGFELENEPDFDPYLFKKIIEECLERTLEEILRRSKNVEISDIMNIATISANNDPAIGKLFQEAYDQTGKDGYINIVESVNGESFTKIIQGYVIDHGYPERKYANNKLTNFFEAKEAYVLIYDNELIEKKEIMDIVKFFDSKARKLPLIIFAKDFSKVTLPIIDFHNMDRSSYGICPIKIPLRNQEYIDLLSDISNYTGAEITKKFDQFSYSEGTANDVIVKQGYTIFGKPGKTRQEILDSYLNDLNLSAAAEASHHIAEEIKKRINKMTKGVTTIYIGANSDIELKEKQHRVDDAYHACRASLQSGRIIGGGQSLLLIALENDNGSHTDKYRKVFYDAISKPFFQILENSNHNEEDRKKIRDKITWEKGYNAKTRKFENLMETGVIDPVKILVDSLTNAVSIATTILNTECTIIDQRNHEN